MLVKYTVSYSIVYKFTYKIMLCINLNQICHVVKILAYILKKYLTCFLSAAEKFYLEAYEMSKKTEIWNLKCRKDFLWKIKLSRFYLQGK